MEENVDFRLPLPILIVPTGNIISELLHGIIILILFYFSLNFSILKFPWKCKSVTMLVIGYSSFFFEKST